MLLSAARSRVRTLADDVEAERYTDAQVDAALGTAQYEALLWAVAATPALFRVEATITTSSQGVADLTAIAPLKMLSVALLNASDRVIIKPLSAASITAPQRAVQQLVIGYVPQPVFPATGASAFVWSSAAVNVPPVDLYMCLIAAAELKIGEGEQPAGLDVRKAECLATLKALFALPSFTVMPMRWIQPRAWMGYCITAPNTLQLARL